MSKEQQGAVNFPDLTYVITWLEGECDPLAAAKELRSYQKQVGGALPPEPQPRAVAAVQAQGDAPKYTIAESHEHGSKMYERGYQEGRAAAITRKLVEKAAEDAMAVFKDSCSHTHQAIDYMKEVMLASLQSQPMPTQGDASIGILVEALDKLSKLGNGDKVGNSIGNAIAYEALDKWAKVLPLQSLTISEKVADMPMQPVIVDESGTHRFKANAIVQKLLDDGPFDMNKLAVMDFTEMDREQFAQLIGYSVSGFGELGYVSDPAYQRAIAASAALSQPPAVEAPKGRWKWMPREATSEMVSAGDDWTEPQNVWRAMFDKAPTISGSTLEAAHRLIEAALPEDEPDCIPDWVCELLINLGMQQAQSVTAVEAPSDIKPYYAGLLNGFGGGNVDWWHDYIRAQLEWAHEFYLSQIAALPALLPKEEAADQIHAMSVRLHKLGDVAHDQSADGGRYYLGQMDAYHFAARLLNELAPSAVQPAKQGTTLRPDQRAVLDDFWEYMETEAIPTIVEKIRRRNEAANAMADVPLTAAAQPDSEIARLTKINTELGAKCNFYILDSARLQNRVTELEAAAQPAEQTTTIDIDAAWRASDQTVPMYKWREIYEAVAAAQSAPSLTDALSDFEEDQWWLQELDAMIKDGTPDQKRAVAVVRNLLKTAKAAQPVQGTQPDDPYWKAVCDNQATRYEKLEQRLAEALADNSILIAQGLGKVAAQGTQAVPEAIAKSAARWDMFKQALRTGHLKGAGHGRRFKVIEVSPMYGDETEFNDFIGAIDFALAAAPQPPAVRDGGAA